MSVLEMMFKGGVMMWPILLCAGVAVYVVVDRFLVLRRAGLDAGQFLPKLKSIYRHGDMSSVLTYCNHKDAPIANILRRGVLKYAQGPARVREAVESAGRGEVFRLERRLGILASIAGLAPMLGFVGTVMGLMKAFRSIEQQNTLVSPALLAGGIWEALLATAFGVIVGIFALVCYNSFVARVRAMVHDMEATSNEFLDVVEESSHVPDDGGGEGAPLRASRPVPVEEEFFRRKE